MCDKTQASKTSPTSHSFQPRTHPDQGTNFSSNIGQHDLDTKSKQVQQDRNIVSSSDYKGKSVDEPGEQMVSETGLSDCCVFLFSDLASTIVENLENIKAEKSNY